MTLETRIKSSLEDGLARLDPGSGDLATVEQLGSRLRRRRRVATAGAVVGVVAVAGTAFVATQSGSNERAEGIDPVSPTGTWRDVSPSPLAPRWGAVSAWTGEEAVFVGGSLGTPCPPNASCTVADKFESDGAAYDPETDTWRTIADAPVAVGYWFRPAVVGDTVVLFGDDRWLAYDAGEDSWRTIPGPERNVVDTGSISAVDGRVYAISQSGIVRVLDVDAGTWSELPASTEQPTLTDGSVVATPEGVFVTGVDATAANDGHEPSLALVDRWDGTSWTRLPATGQLGTSWHWTGVRLLAVGLGGADGGEVEPWDRFYPYGGRLDVDTGAWTPLPSPPDPEAGPQPDGWSVNASEGPLVAGWRYLYDDGAETWTALGKPGDTDVDVDQSAVWADGKLVVFGGLDEETGYQDVAGLSNEAWVWTP